VQTQNKPVGRRPFGTWPKRVKWFPVALMLLALVACSKQPSAPPGAMVPIVLEDYRIRSSVNTVAAGTVTFNVYSKGPSTHELAVFGTNRPAGQLPLGDDGLRIDEDSSLLREAGELEQVDIGETETFVLRLPPGRYVLVCNMEGHYLGGMYFSLIVH
jgi:uncharacterized cupredoxin-like copper-binding protein